MRITTRVLATVALAALTLSLFVTPASAATASWSLIEVRLINGTNNQPGVLVGGQLPASTSLPASVVLSVPNGKPVDWAGEILGGPVQNDPTATYNTTGKSGYDEISFTLTKAKRGQVEYTASEDVVSSGSGKTANLTWTSPVDVPSVGLYIEVPNGAQVQNPSGALTERNGTSTFYYKQFQNVKKGQALSLSVSYTGGAFAPQTQTGGGSSSLPQQTSGGGTGDNTLVIGVIALGVILVGMFFALRRFSTPAYEDDEEYEEEYEEPEPEPVPKPARKRTTASSTAAKSTTAAAKKTTGSDTGTAKKTSSGTTRKSASAAKDAGTDEAAEKPAPRPRKAAPKPKPAPEPEPEPVIEVDDTDPFSDAAGY